ncbi:GPI-anchored cupredoxin-like protein 1 [Colletotrichum truncatum]|uniref:GPI-anchored cupredoxin-like protein 1 n=1 Tax=Colletotrichum truncatum TaxID=5467 RepID=A0ACC3Z9W1_COLTU|nr:GPI-anchored cupredoxin-like protein 1 [Colletotrichum truncatum]KAF6796022.1 GPI-anchored cupredoxin-like protein 1 [Colletotrichum truncatum]
MKFSAVLALSTAVLASAKSVRNHYPVRRDGHKKAGSEVGKALPAGMSGFGVSNSQVTEVIIIWTNPGAGAPTININPPAGGVAAPPAAPPAAPAAPAAPPAAPPAAGPQTHHSRSNFLSQVTVGGPSGLVFVPDQIKANVGDMVVFTFMSQNHTATQSAFATPCDPLAGGMDSGFVANPNNSVNPPPQVAMQVMVSDPLWFYCRQGNHCGKGMTFSINPTAEKTQALFQSMAIQQKGKGAPSAIVGGQPPAAAPATPSAPAAEPPAAAPPAANPAAPPAAGGGATGGVQTGTGQINGNGACVCAVSCTAGSFPAAVQGVGAFGGMAGSLPMEMMEA